MNHLNELTMFEKDLLLLWFMHHMPMDQREKMMLELPVIYKKMTGVDVYRKYMEEHKEEMPVTSKPVVNMDEVEEAIAMHEKEEAHQQIREDMDWWYYGASGVYNIHNHGREGKDKLIFQVDVYQYMNDGTDRADYSSWNTVKTYNMKEMIDAKYTA